MIRFLFLLVFCTPSLEAREGFFSPTAYSALAQTDISAKTIAAVLPTVGAFIVESDHEYPWKEIQSIRDVRCKGDLIRAWNREFCTALANADCSVEGLCTVHRTSSCAGVVVNGFFVTARHCSEGRGNQAARAKFIDSNGLPVTLVLERTALTEHKLPDDLSLLRIPDYKGEQARIRRQGPKNGEPVFGVGFPYFHTRQRKRADYTAPGGDPRITLGHIVDEQLKDPEQRHLFGADTDMINGMSGSPLFDKRGRLLGIASNTYKKEPYDYDAAKPALYVKAERIQHLIGKLDEEERRLKAEAETRRLQEKLEEAKSLESRQRWDEAEAAFEALKSDFPEIAKTSLRFISCETGRKRPRRTFPRVEYLESIVLSALSDGSQDRLSQLLPCRVPHEEIDLHSEDFISNLLKRRINGVPPEIQNRERIEDRIEASLMGVAGKVTLIWKRDLNGGWAFYSAILN